MATFYIDPQLGNDANAGTSTGTAWKTITNGPTAARVAPGDLIKVKRSPEFTISGTTWTNNSGTVTLPAATTLSIEQGVGNSWTAANINVTTGTATTRKLGINAQQLTIAAGFTTGKIAHKATGTLNLSSYSKVSFWIRTSVAIAANTLTLRLCSDTTGDTPVHTITIPPLSVNTFYPIVWDNGAPLSSSIQSVSLATSVDPGIPVLLIQNIFATNNISLCGTFGPTSSTAFYSASSIVDTNVSLDLSDTTTATVVSWIGTTGTYTTTFIESYIADLINGNITNTFELNEAGTSALATTLSGGWDFGTDTRTGYTSYVRYSGSVSSYYNLIYENFILARLKTAINPGASGYVTYKNIIFAGTSGSVLNLTDVGRKPVYENISLYQCASAITGTTSGAEKTFKNCTFVAVSTLIALNFPVVFMGCTFLNTVIASNNPPCEVIFKTCVFTSTSLPTWSTTNNEVRFSLENCTGASMPLITTRLVVGHQFQAWWQTTTKQGLDPGAWRFDSFGTSREIGTPNLFKIGEILCSTPSVPVTVTAWMKKDNATGIGISLGVLGSELAGVNETFTTKANNTSWEQVSITFTPTQAGVISLYSRMWHAGTSSNVYIGSISIT